LQKASSLPLRQTLRGRLQEEDGYSMRRRIVIDTGTLLGPLVFAVFCLLSLTGVKVFEAWPQVTVLWDSGWPLLYFIDHFHFERYLAAYPGLMLEERLPGIGFSIYISLFATINTLLFRQVHMNFTGYRPSLFAYVIFLLIHLAMNGRGPIGWAGWLLCLGLHGRFDAPDRTGPFMTITNSSLLFFSILFSSVSSGVFMVVFLSNAMLIARVLRGSLHIHRLSLGRVLTLLFASAIIGYGIYRAILYLLDAVVKIHLFFGSYSAVITHGVGLLVERYELSVVLLVAAILGISFALFWTFLKGRIAPVLWPLMAISMVGGAFGFTTLTLNIPLVLIFISILIREFLSNLTSQTQT